MAHDHRKGIKPDGLLDEILIFADSLAVFLESKDGLNLEKSLPKEKPWILENLTKFSDKYDLDIPKLIEQIRIIFTD